MNFTAEEIKEFEVEALELLDSAEKDLLGFESGGKFQSHYDAIFRVFHSLKGGAGMLGLTSLQNHMHSLESIFSKLKTATTLDQTTISFFLNGIDASRRILNGEDVQFNYDLKPEAAKSESVVATPTPAVAPPPTAPRTKTDQPVPATTAPAKAPVPASQEPVLPTSAKFDKPLVYAVDDEPDILEIIKDILNNANIECRTFDDPTMCIAAVIEHQPTAILVDMKMPKMDGLELLKEVKKIDHDIPVILVSGYLDKTILLELIENGVFGAIEKPFETKGFLSHVFHAIRHRELAKLLNRSVQLLIYQFVDLDKFLQEHGKEDIRTTIRTEMEMIIELRKKLKKFLK